MKFKALASTMLRFHFVLISAFCFFGYAPLAKADNIANTTDASIETLTSDFLYKNSPSSQDPAIISQIRLQNWMILNDAVSGYQINQTVFLPLIEFCKTLEFSIDVNEDKSKISGWFINDNRRFLLDAKQGIIRSDKSKYAIAKLDDEHSISSNHIKIIDNNVFVDLWLLQKLFPIKVSFISTDQLIQIDSLEQLPIEKEMERAKRWDELAQNIENSKKATQDDGIQTIKTPYKLISIPVADINTSYQYNGSKTGPASSNFQLNALMSGDLLYFNHQFATTISKDQITGARLTMGRKDPNAKLLGPLKATEFSFGDVYSPQMPLVSRGRGGKGVVVSNYPEGYVDNLNTVPIRGDIQPGWDVELYRNDSLIDFRKASDNLQYQFLDVPLISGYNIIKLVFYGPFGQKREEIRHFLINQDLIKKNQLYYRFAVNKNNENLIKINNGNNSSFKNPTDGINRGFGELAFGLTKNTSIVTNFTNAPIDNTNEVHNYSSVSLRSSLFGVYGRVDAIKDLTNKLSATRTSLQTRLFDYSLSAQNDHYNKNFISEEHQISADPILNETTIKIDGPFSIPYLLKSARLSLSATQNQSYSKNNRKNFNGDISFALGRGFDFSQNIFHSIDSIMANSNKNVTTNGRTYLNYVVSNQLSLRAGLSYTIKPIKELSSSSISANYKFKNDLSLNLNQDHQFASSVGGKSSNNYSTSLSKSFDKYIMSAGANYNSSGSYGVNINFSISFGYDAKYNVGKVSGSSMANSGLIAAKVFLDENNNDVYDKGETLLPDVELRPEGGGSKTKTNQNGVALISQVPVNYPVKVKLDTAGIDNPYWIIKKPTTKIITHPGAITNIEFPITITGDLSGYVKINQDKKLVDASDVILELVDEKGIVVKTATTSYDGFYLIDAVPYGSYSVRISEEQLIRLNLSSDKPSQKIAIDKEKSSVNDVDFVIHPKI